MLRFQLPSANQRSSRLKGSLGVEKGILSLTCDCYSIAKANG